MMVLSSYSIHPTKLLIWIKWQVTRMLVNDIHWNVLIRSYIHGMVSCFWHDCLVHKWIILLIHICMKKKGVLQLEAWSIDSKPYQKSVTHHFWTGLLWSRSCYKNGIIQFRLAIWRIQARVLFSLHSIWDYKDRIEHFAVCCFSPG